MQVRFATANLLNYLAPPNAFYEFNNIYEATQWQQKQRWLNHKLIELNADVIGFQEIFSADALREQMHDLGYPYFEVIDTPQVSDDYIYSSPVVGIASRYPLSDVVAVDAQQPDFHFTATASRNGASSGSGSYRCVCGAFQISAPDAQ